MDKTCPECGGQEVDGLDCWWQLGAIGQWEFSDPELSKLHFYTVACYNLQHPARFTDEAIAALKCVFCTALDNGWTNEQVRAHVNRQWDDKTKVTLKAPRPTVLRKWSMTISDIYRPNQPEAAADRAVAWAKAVRAEL